MTDFDVSINKKEDSCIFESEYLALDQDRDVRDCLSEPTIGKGRHSQGGAAFFGSATPNIGVPEPEENDDGLTEIKQWAKAKRTIIDQQATDKPILGGFSVTLPRRGYRKEEKRMTVEVVQSLLKPRVARLEGLSGPGDQRLIFADFDALPRGFLSFDQLSFMLSNHFHDEACVLRSSGGRLKVIFRTLGKNWSQAEVRKFLAWKLNIFGNLWEEDDPHSLGPSLNAKAKKCVDRAAIDHSYINYEMLEVLWDRYKTMTVHTYFKPVKIPSQKTRPLHPDQVGDSSIAATPSTSFSPSTIYSAGVVPFEMKDSPEIPPEPSSFDWNCFGGEIPDDIQKLRNNELLVKVFRAAAGAFYLSTTYGVALPQEYLGRLFEVSHQQVGNAIGRLIKLEVIRKTMPACHLQGRAARYQFVGKYLTWARDEFAKIIEKLRKNNSSAGQNGFKAAVEARFKPGEMNLALFEYTRFFDSFEAYLSACKEHSYFGAKPEHIHQATWAWVCRERIREKEARESPHYLKEA